MITRAARRNIIGRWLNYLIRLAALITIGIATWSFIAYRNSMAKVNHDTPQPDANIVAIISNQALNPPVQQQFKNSLERPLMLLSRRPFIKPLPTDETELSTESESQNPIKPITGRLSSIIINGHHKTIFLNVGKSTVRLEQGMIYDHWRLSRIEKNSATFIAGNKEQTLPLRVFSSARTTPVRLLNRNHSPKTATTK